MINAIKKSMKKVKKNKEKVFAITSEGKVGITPNHPTHKFEIYPPNPQIIYNDKAI